MSQPVICKPKNYLNTYIHVEKTCFVGKFQQKHVFSTWNGLTNGWYHVYKMINLVWTNFKRPTERPTKLPTVRPTQRPTINPTETPPSREDVGLNVSSIFKVPTVLTSKYFKKNGTTTILRFTVDGNKTFTQRNEFPAKIKGIVLSIAFDYSER